MASQFQNLPAPSADGSGAAVDVSSCGATKTIVSSGDSVATLNIEINNDVGHAGSWTTVGTFVARGILRLMLAVRWMRVTVSRYTSGTPQVDLGSSSDGTTFAALPVTAGDGVGAAVDTSALGLFKTVQVGGPFAGIVNVEVSEDGNTKWATLFTFDAPGQQSLPLEAKWMRVVRAGQRPMVAPGTPIVTVGGTESGGGGSAVPDQAMAFQDGASLTGELAVAQIVNAGLPVRQVSMTNLVVTGAFPNGSFGAQSSTLSQDTFIGGPIILHNTASPAALPNGNTDDWGVAGEFGPQPYGFCRINVIAQAGALLTGIDASPLSWPYNGGQLDGFILFLFNISANAFTLKNDARSIGANRFKLPNGADIVVNPKQGVFLMYNGNGAITAWTKCS